LWNSFFPNVVVRVVNRVQRHFQEYSEKRTNRICRRRSEHEWRGHCILYGCHWKYDLGSLIHTRVVWRKLCAKSWLVIGSFWSYSIDTLDFLGNGFQCLVFCQNRWGRQNEKNQRQNVGAYLSHSQSLKYFYTCNEKPLQFSSLD